MRQTRLLLAIALVGATLLGCSDRPKDVLSEKDMASLMADMELADAYIMGRREFSEDSMRRLLHESVLERHGVTNAQMDSSMKWYGENLDIYVEVQEKVIDKLRHSSAKLMPLTGGADAGLWTYPRMMRVSPLSPDDGIVFSLSPSGLKPGEVLELSGRIIEPSAGIKSLIGVEYNDGTAGYVTRDFSSLGERRFTTELQTDSSKSVNRIFGTIRSSDSNSRQLIIDSLAMQHRPFDASLYQRINSQRLYRLPHKKKEVKSEIPNTLPEPNDSASRIAPKPATPPPPPVPNAKKQSEKNSGPPSIPAPGNRK